MARILRFRSAAQRQKLKEEKIEEVLKTEETPTIKEEPIVGRPD